MSAARQFAAMDMALCLRLRRNEWSFPNIEGGETGR
jgi:hypothetical protein